MLLAFQSVMRYSIHIRTGTFENRAPIIVVLMPVRTGSLKSLVVDVGQSIVGVQNARSGRYIAYYGERRRRAIERLENADEVITYNGARYDISELNKISNTIRGEKLRLSGIHTDMQKLCWPGILGSDLASTFKKHIDIEQRFPDTYEGSNQNDVYMTKMLWRHWKEHGNF